MTKKQEKKIKNILEELINSWKLGQLGIEDPRSTEPFDKAHTAICEILNSREMHPTYIYSNERPPTVEDVLNIPVDGEFLGMGKFTKEQKLAIRGFKEYIKVMGRKTS